MSGRFTRKISADISVHNHKKHDIIITSDRASVFKEDPICNCGKHSRKGEEYETKNACLI